VLLGLGPISSSPGRPVIAPNGPPLPCCGPLLLRLAPASAAPDRCWLPDPINRRSTRQLTSRTELPSLALSAGCVPSAGPHSIPFFASILVALMSPVLAHPATPKPQNVCAPPSCCSTSKPHRRRASERWQFQFLPFSMNNTARHGHRRFVAVGENLAHSLLP
jgi:hypothetical protein